jgi:hypothetical protein
VAGQEGVVTIAIRLVHGLPHQRRFPAEAPVSAVYDWVMTLEEVAAESRSHVTLMEYPRRVLADGAQTLTELELPARAMLLLKEETG